MALSVVQFLVLLGAAVAVPPVGRYFSEDPWSRQSADVYGRQAVPAYRQSAYAYGRHRQSADVYGRQAVPEYRQSAEAYGRHAVPEYRQSADAYRQSVDAYGRHAVPAYRQSVDAYGRHAVPAYRQSADVYGRQAVPAYRQSADVYGRQAVPAYRRAADVMCPQKIANTIKLAIVYTELSEAIRPLYAILHDLYIEPGMADVVSSVMSSARALQPRYLLDSAYSHRVPMVLWTMSELRPVIVQRTPTARMFEKFSRKLAEDCSALMSEREVSAVINHLYKAESAFIAEVKGIISRLPASSGVTSRLISRIDVVASTMAWARNLVKSEIAFPAQIITHWIETRRPIFDAPGASIFDAAGASIFDAAGASIYDAAGASIYDAAGASIYDAAGASIYDAAGASIYDAAGASNEESDESWESWEAPETWESRGSWNSNEMFMADAPVVASISVRVPSPTEVRCYKQKVDMYKLLLINCLVGLDSIGLEKTLERAMTSPEVSIKPAKLSVIRQQLPPAITDMMRTAHVKIADIFNEPSVAAVVAGARPKFEVLLNVHGLSSLTSEPAKLGQALQAAVDAIMASDKLCAVDAGFLNRNLTAIIGHIQGRMRLSEIKAAVKPVFSRHIDAVAIKKVFSVFESRYVPIMDLHKRIVRCLSADLSTVAPRPEPLIARFSVLLASSRVPASALLSSPMVQAAPEAASSDVLESSLRRVGVEPGTPLMLVAGALLREVLRDVAAHLAPSSAPCARIAAIKVAAAFSRTAIIKELSYEERFIELFAKKSVQSIPQEQLRVIGEEIRKVIIGKIEKTFADEGIEKAERIFKDILSIAPAAFEKPVPEVINPLVEKMKPVLAAIKCEENAEDIRQKSIVAIINSLKAPIAAPEIVAIVKKVVKDPAQEAEVVALLTRVLPELTGGLLEEVQLMNQYVEDGHMKHFPLVFSDCIVRVVSEVSPVPIIREMTALFPRESPMAIVIQPRARRLTRHIADRLFNSVKAKGVKIPKEEFKIVIKAVIAKLNKLGYKSPEPSNESFKPSSISYDVAERTMSVIGDVALEAASPSVIRHVISLAMRDLEEADLRPECLNAARVQLMAGVLRVLLERHVLMATPESGMFVTVYKILRPDVHALEDIQKVAGVIAASFRTKVKEAMAGLAMFADTARTEAVVQEVFRLPYERLSGLTLRELLVEPLSKMKAFYKGVSSCSFDMNAFTREVDTFSERWAQMALTKADFSQLLAPVLSDRALLEKVSVKVEAVVVPEIRHHVAAAFIYTKNAIIAESPAVFRRFFGRIIVSTFGLKSPAPLRGFIEHPLFDVFTTELYTELMHKLTELKVERPEAERLINDAIIRSLEESSPAPMSPYMHRRRRADNQL